jgi:acyl carrier protein
MKDEVFNRVKKFVTKQAAVYENEVTDDASLENDLGVYGDDAIEFIVAFGKEFNVDVSRFMAADYFRGEGGDFLESFGQIFTNKSIAHRKDLKVKHLIKAALAGSLDEEVINS